MDKNKNLHRESNPRSTTQETHLELRGSFPTTFSFLELFMGFHLLIFKRFGNFSYVIISLMVAGASLREPTLATIDLPLTLVNSSTD